MAGVERTVGFLLFLAVLAVVPSVNGYCTSHSQCYPGNCSSGRCECPEGYNDTARSNCSTNVSISCNPVCENGGTCYESDSHSYCECPRGYTGSYCQDKACSRACRNGGTCRSSSSSARCVCPSGYTGAYCQYRVLLSCRPPCRNRGTCYISLHSLPYCKCPSGYRGLYCQYRDCTPACQNGGTCQSSTSDAYCNCRSGYTGSYCQYRECSSSCIRNGGICSSVVCVCPPGSSGSNCQLSSSSSSSSSSLSGDGVGIVVGSVIGSAALLLCMGGISIWAVYQRRFARERRSPNVETAPVHVAFACINRETTVVGRLHNVPPINPDAPPPYALSADMQSSDPPPYTTDPTNGPLHTFVEDTPTPQPLPPEFSPSVSDDEDPPPEYLPPPESDQGAEPLQGAPPTNPDVSTPSAPSADVLSSDPPPCATDVNNCSTPTYSEDTPTPPPLSQESYSSVPNDEDMTLEYLPHLDSSDQEKQPLLEEQ